MEFDYPLYCDKCWFTKDTKIAMELEIIEKTAWEAGYLRAKEDTRDNDELYPTFDVETGRGTVEWTAEFFCPKCKDRPKALNENIYYNEDEDTLMISCLDADDPLGWFSPLWLATPKKEVVLPKIQHVRDLQNARP